MLVTKDFQTFGLIYYKIFILTFILINKDFQTWLLITAASQSETMLEIPC